MVIYYVEFTDWMLMSLDNGMILRAWHARKDQTAQSIESIQKKFRKDIYLFWNNISEVLVLVGSLD